MCWIQLTTFRHGDDHSDDDWAWERIYCASYRRISCIDRWIPHLTDIRTVEIIEEYYRGNRCSFDKGVELHYDADSASFVYSGDDFDKYVLMASHSRNQMRRGNSNGPQISQQEMSAGLNYQGCQVTGANKWGQGAEQNVDHGWVYHDYYQACRGGYRRFEEGYRRFHDRDCGPVYHMFQEGGSSERNLQSSREHQPIRGFGHQDDVSRPPEIIPVVHPAKEALRGPQPFQLCATAPSWNPEGAWSSPREPAVTEPFVSTVHRGLSSSPPRGRANRKRCRPRHHRVRSAMADDELGSERS